jgi:molybdate transport system substrate-binding protein
MTALISEYRKQHPRADISVSSASSGVLLAQIKRGAPFELFFSADSERPLALAKELDLTDKVHTYAIGRLVLWAPNVDGVNLDSIAQFKRKIAIAKPELAPYGLATMQTLEKNNLWENTQHTAAYGNNVTQVEHFVKTGTVSAGFLSLAQVMHSNANMRHVWIVPKEYHEPIEQKVILLNQKGETPLSLSFLDFVLSDKGQAIISELGYGRHSR